MDGHRKQAWPAGRLVDSFDCLIILVPPTAVKLPPILVFARHEFDSTYSAINAFDYFMIECIQIELYGSDAITPYL